MEINCYDVQISKRATGSPAITDSQQAANNTAFFQVLSVAWSYIDDDEKSSIRAVSVDGRLLYDRACTAVSVTLGDDPDPSPAEIASSMAGLLVRGAQVEEIAVEQIGFGEGGPAAAESQLLALFAALANPALANISFEGAVYLTPSVVAAAAICAPTSLEIRCSAPVPYNDLQDQSTSAAVELLQRCLPGLSSLGLYDIGDWPIQQLRVLSLGTQLTELSLDLNHASDDRSNCSKDVNTVLDAIGGLQRLQRMDLFFEGQKVCPYNYPNSAMIRFLPLGSLTALTRLVMDIPLCTSWENTWQMDMMPWDMQRVWRLLWQRQRARLMDALRGLPALAHLNVFGMQLDVRDLGALTALTFLAAKGLVLPSQQPDVAPYVVGMDAEAEAQDEDITAAPAGTAAAVPVDVDGSTTGLLNAAPWPLPPKIRVLRLQVASPSALGVLTAPTCWPGLDLQLPGGLTFNELDFRHEDPGADDDDGHGLMRQYGPFVYLPPRAIAAFTAAAPLFAGRQVHGCGLNGSLRVQADVEEGQLLACRDSTLILQDLDGHAGWLAALAPLQLQDLTLVRFKLNFNDVKVLVRHLPLLKTLRLERTVIPPVAMFPLATLQRLEHLTLSFSGFTGNTFCSWDDEEVSEPALLHFGLEAPSLRTWTIEGAHMSHNRPLHARRQFHDVIGTLKGTLRSRRQGVILQVAWPEMLHRVAGLG